MGSRPGPDDTTRKHAEEILAAADEVILPDMDTALVLSVAAEERLSRRIGLPLREVHRLALEQGAMPSRYLRNTKRLDAAMQLRLLESTVAQVGLGGLGGLTAEALARLGVGTLRGADGDIFDEHNLNRQLLATSATLGASKAGAARERLALVNPALRFRAVERVLDALDMEGFVRGADLAVDALGGLDSREALERACARAGVPLVAGAVAGQAGWVAVVRPGEQGPASLLGRGSAAEDRLGTQAPGVYAVAALMSAEAERMLLTGDSPLAGKMLLIDLDAMSFETVSLT